MKNAISVMSPRLSVYALIENSARSILVIRRSGTNRRFADKWEFPGGKVRQGEKPVEALIREVSEESNLEIAVADSLGVYRYQLDGLDMDVQIYSANVISGELRLANDHDKALWIKPSLLLSLDFRPGIREFCEHLSVTGLSAIASGTGGIL